MASFQYFGSALVTIFTTPTYMFFILAFTALGILLGALPGISVNMTLILALPLTYGMDSETAMAVLISCYIGSLSGGLISAITLNIPGTSTSISTTFDGYPMAERGEAGRAVGVGILTSFVGGTFSYILLLFLAPLMGSVALRFGNWEYFSIGMFSLTMIISIAGDDVWKGVLSSALGMALAMTGPDPVSGILRYDFGLSALAGGVTTTALMCGIFAVPEILKLAEVRDDHQTEIRKVEKFRGYGISAKEYLSHWKNILRSAFIGTYVGVLPGVGAASASLLSYMTAKNQSKHPETFGTGDMDGLIASETANNACMGGAMIPMLALGIPGSAAAAILLSSLTLHNVQCGPLVFSRNTTLVYFVFAVCFVANIVMLIVERVVLNGYIKVLTAPRRIVMVFVFMMCVIGAYSARSNYTDILVFVLGGALGYFMKKAGIPTAPIILGYILSEIIERNFVQAMSLSRGNFMAITNRPIAIVFMILAVVSFISSVRKTIKTGRERRAKEETETT